MTSEVGQHATARRIAWVDGAKGMAVLLVALYHAQQFLRYAGVDSPFWRAFDGLLQTLRMPLFFTTAGLFATKYLQGSWRTLLSKKVVLFGWLYVLWNVLRFVTFSLVRGTDPAPGYYGLSRLAASPLVPDDWLWFIYGLAVFFTIAKAARRIDVRVQIATAAVLSAAAFARADYRALPLGWSGMAKYLVFFLVGCYLRESILVAAATLTWRRSAAIVLGWVGVYAGLKLFGLVTPFGIVVAGLGAVAGVAIATRAAGIRPLTYVGRNTLPIFLAHMLVIDAAASWVGRHGEPGILRPVLPLVVAALGVLFALALWWIAGVLRIRGWLYEAPRLRPRLRALAVARARGLEPGTTWFTRRKLI